MLKLTRTQLFYALEAGLEDGYDNYLAHIETCNARNTGPALDVATYTALEACDLKPIVAGSEMSENKLGGDHLASVADDVLAAIAEGYTIETWYGPNSEALVVCYRPEQLEPNWTKPKAKNKRKK